MEQNILFVATFAFVFVTLVVAKYEQLFPDAETMRSRPSVTDGLARAAAEGIGLHRQTGGARNLAIGHG